MNANPDAILNVDAALRGALAAGLARLDAQLLLAEALGETRAWLYAHGDAPLPPPTAARFADWVQRRGQGEPVAYLVGHKAFHGLHLHVSPAVLVPRPDTETLVDWALETLASPGAPRSPSVADLGTGSGAIALAVKQAHPAASVAAVDISADALAVARANGERLGLVVDWRLGAWWAPLTGQRVSLAVSNPPYIAGADPHLAALAHEPRLALTPEGDGLSALAAIVSGARAHLEPGGWLLLEHGYDQASAVARLLADAGFQEISSRRDLGGQMRCTGGRCL